jgi:hypothetical protein
LIAAFVIAGALAHWAPSSPDGFEWAAGRLGLEGRAKEKALQVMPDYALPGLGSRFLSGSLSGVIGVAAVFGALLGLGKLLGQRGRPVEDAQPDDRESPHAPSAH